MQVSFDEMKTLFQGMYVNLDDLVVSNDGVSAENWQRSEVAYARLELISKLAAAICEYRPIIFNRN